ncbi:hypothetical protein CVIRNUC_000224 [Coccomyxa viridis]|uniref:Uncharacterized protein n=1 Tax=Coccomyxa viridis TaxID=1274662 RepID=A0AAV1HSE2_9CHLO|nr:hypothetical protein CVIRNUC_000224 [Coccomyxa viridis]
MPELQGLEEGHPCLCILLWRKLLQHLCILSHFAQVQGRQRCSPSLRWVAASILHWRAHQQHPGHMTSCISCRRRSLEDLLAEVASAAKDTSGVNHDTGCSVCLA